MKEARKALAKSGGDANLKKHGKDFYKSISAKGVAARMAKKIKTNDEKIEELIARGYDITTQ